MIGDYAVGAKVQENVADLFIAVRRAALPGDVQGLRASPACPAKS